MGQNKKKSGKNKAKGKKNEPSTSRTVDDYDFEDLTEGVDDDGTINPEDVQCFCKLIFSETYTLRQLGTELLDKFKNRSMLSIGTALSLMFEYLSNFDHVRDNCDNLRQRLILQYLVYRCRELEPMMKRKQDRRKDSMMGHPFVDFIIRAYYQDIVNPFAHDYEHNFACLMLCKRGVELGSLEVRMLPDVARSLILPKQSEIDINITEIDEWRGIAMEAWPKSFELSADVPFMFRADADKSKASEPEPLTMSKFSKRMTTILCEEEPQYVLHGLEIPIDSVYRLDEHPLHRFLSTSSPAGIVTDEAMSDDPKPEDTFEESRDTLKELIADVVTKIEDGNELNDEEAILAHSFMLLMDPDDPVVQKLRSSNVKKLAFDGFSSLVSSNYKTASDMLFNLVVLNKSIIQGILAMFCMMDVSVQVLEIVRRLYETIPDLPKDPIQQYAMYCVDYCQQDKVPASQKTRCVRLVCMFISSLIKQKILDIRDTSMSSLQSFCLKFNQLKEATTLYQLLVELNRKS